MSAGVLIISHNRIGAALFGAAKFMIKGSPFNVKLLPANRDSGGIDGITINQAIANE
tara:strand:- start:1121 stop:1291 length:171 start_codon:yes stop_codon:yes gene_type:complete